MDIDVVQVCAYDHFESFDDANKLCKSFNDQISVSARDYVWYYGKTFRFYVCQFKGQYLLKCSLPFGDCLDDQWYVVKLIIDLSLKFENVAFSLTNNTEDQFLLVECANFLPSYITPEVSSKRTFIFCGLLHFIPFPTNPGLVTFLGTIDPVDCFLAIKVLKKYPSQCKLADAVQKCIWARTCKFNKPHEFSHRAYITIPASLGALVHKHPGLVCTLSHKYLCSTRPAGEVRDETFVKIAVRFPRLLYARLISRDVLVPSSWQNSFGSPSALGYQLWSGLKVHGKDLTDNRKRFMEKLNEMGYFQDEIEGSIKYRELTELALQNLPFDEPNPSISKEDIDDFLSIQGPLPDEDDDSWLEVTNEKIDSLLNEQNYTVDLKSIPIAMNKFLSHPIELLDGVEVPWTNTHNEPVKCDADEVIGHLKNLLSDSQSSGDEADVSDIDSSADDELGPSYDGDADDILVKSALDSAAYDDDPEMLAPIAALFKAVGIDLPLY